MCEGRKELVNGYQDGCVGLFEHLVGDPGVSVHSAERWPFGTQEVRRGCVWGVGVGWKRKSRRSMT